jgi:hypothetical protein
VEGEVERTDESETVANDAVDSRLLRHNFEGDNDNSDREGLVKFVDQEEVHFRGNFSEPVDKDHFLLGVLGEFKTAGVV